MDTRKTTLGRADALKLAREVTDLHVTKGKKVTHLKLKDAPDDEALAALLLGPTGNLRAPTLRKGKTLVVGFDEEVYRKVLGK